MRGNRKKNCDWRVDAKVNEAANRVGREILDRERFLTQELYLGEATKSIRQRQTAEKLAELKRLVTDLNSSWQAVSKFITPEIPNHVDQVSFYAQLLRLLISKSPRPQQAKSEIDKQWDAVLRDIKRLRRSVEEADRIGDWKIAGVAELPQNRDTKSAWEQLPTVRRFLEQLHDIVKDGPSPSPRRVFSQYSELTPKYEAGSTVQRKHLWRILADCFQERCGKMPWTIIARLTEGALRIDHVSPGTIARDIQRMQTAEKTGHLGEK